MILLLAGSMAILIVVMYIVVLPQWQHRKNTAILQATAIVISASALYLLLGAPEKIDDSYWQQRTPEQVFSDLQRYLRSEKSDSSAWMLLANVGMNTGRYDEAAAAYSRLIDMNGEQPELLLGLADAMAMNAGGNLDGKPEELLHRVLLTDPDNTGAMWMLSMSAHSKGQLQDAIARWKKLWKLVDSDQQKLQLLDLMRASGAELPPMLILHLSIDQKETTPDPDLPVFVFARDPGGAAKPVAALKRSVAHLPTVVVLDDSNVITEGISLADYEQLVVSARVATSADIKPSPQDLVATPTIITPGQHVALQLSRE